MSTNITVEGRLGGDPELRFTAQGKAVASFSVVSSKARKLDDGTWEDTETTWRRVTCWDTLAENVCDSLTKGDAVIVTGREYLDEWENDQGKSGVTLKVNAYNVGPSLKRATARVQRAERSGTTNTGRAAAADPWDSGPVNTPANVEQPPF